MAHASNRGYPAVERPPRSLAPPARVARQTVKSRHAWRAAQMVIAPAALPCRGAGQGIPPSLRAASSGTAVAKMVESSDVRGKVIGKLRDTMWATLADAKTASERAYVATPPSSR